jgi:plastocyanin
VAQRRLRARFAGGIIGALLALGAVAGTALAADHAVAISGFSYSPGTVTVAVGDTVTWTNSDAQGHTATADGGSFDTGTLGNGETGTVTFSAAGSFPYHCTIHPQMTGTVVVEAAAASEAPASEAPASGGGGGTTTPPPTDTAPAETTASISSLGMAVLLVVGAVVLGFAIAGRRFVRA